MKLYRAILVTALLTVISSAAVAAWTPETNISPEFAGGTGQPAVAFDSINRLHLVFCANPSGESVHLYYRLFDGFAWTPAIDLPGPNYKEPDCAIAIDSTGVVHVVGTYRLDGTVNLPYTVFYWSYNGSTWTGPTMLSSGQGTDSNNAMAPVLAVDRDNDVHVAWTQNGMVGGAGDILYRKKQAGVWQAVQNVTSNSPGTSYGSVSPDLAVDRNGNTVHLVWHDDFLSNGFQVYYTKNTNLGDAAGWTPKAQWYQLSTGDYGKTPRILLDGSGNPHAFWTDRFGGTTNVVGYSRWTGSAWTAPANWGAIGYQGGAFDSAGKLRFIYTADTGGTLELYHRSYDVAAGTFATAESISTGANTLKVDYGSMAVDYYGYSNIVWEERKGAWPGVGGFYYSAQAYPTRPPIPHSGTLAGYVRDQFGAAVAGARVYTQAGWGTVSAVNGSYSVSLPSGIQDVTAEKDFYSGQTVSVTITENQTTTKEFITSGQAPAPLAAFTVVQGNQSNQLNWTCPSSANLNGLVIRYRTTGYPTGPTDGTLLLDQGLLPGVSSSSVHGGTNGTTYYYAAFTYFTGASRYYSTVFRGAGTPAGPSDMDRDGDVDQADFGLFQDCMTGPFVAQTDPACAGARLDADDDVDQDDAMLFIRCFSGPGVTSNPNCAVP